MCRYTCSLQREGYRRALATNITTSANGTTVETRAYSFDALGRPVSRNADSFGYNTRGEVDYSFMAAENAEDAYSYDHIRNLALHESPAATNAYTANNLNQYTSIQRTSASSALSAGETALTYDLDGNMTQCGDWAYTYDSANRLTSVSSNGISVATFAYDAKSRRVRKTTPTATHTYFYDDWNLVKETVQRSNGSTVQRTYVWGKDLSGTLQGAGGVGGLLAVIHDNIPYFPCYDNNGNITRYLDASGATVAAYTYDAFGRTVAATGPLADTFPHRFSTKYFDLETGLYYYGYRYYYPWLMRWLTRDPIEEDGGNNLYSLCTNSPVSSFDSFGLDRFLTKFDIFGIRGTSEGFLNCNIHVGIAVETWEKRKTNPHSECWYWQRTGIKTFDFGPDYSSVWGLPGVLLFVGKGKVSVSSGLTLANPIRQASTPEEDREMLKHLK